MAQGQLSFSSLAAAHPALLASGYPLIPTSSAVGSPVASLSSINIPCSTLFVANLGPLVNEQELKEIFGRFLFKLALPFT